MATVKAFCGLRYRQANIEDLVTPPYDIISAEEQEAYYQKNAHNIIRLEYGKTKESDNDSDNRYTRAGAFLKQWMEEGVLAKEDKPSLYVYEEVFTLADGTQKSIQGLVARVLLQEFSDNVVLPHEETLSKAKEDRFHLMESTFANFSQIYALYSDAEQKIPTLTANAPKTELADFADEAGIRQRLWKIEDSTAIQSITQAFSDKQLFIADGHHRYETGLRFKKAHPECENAQYIMMFLTHMENDGLVVFPTHRVITNLTVDTEAFLHTLSEFDIEPCAVGSGNIQTEEKAAFVLVLKDKEYILRLKDEAFVKAAIPNKSEAYQTLDVNVLHKLILEKLGIDSENMAQQKNLVYTRSAEEARAMVSSGEACMAFLMNATKVAQIRDVSLAGEKMPQKSTYFYPKLKTGLVMHKF